MEPHRTYVIVFFLTIIGCQVKTDQKQNLKKSDAELSYSSVKKSDAELSYSSEKKI